jgi:hypothetical protein
VSIQQRVVTITRSTRLDLALADDLAEVVRAAIVAARRSQG